MLNPLLAVLALIATSGCKTMLTEATATERALCRAWGESLPTRSRSDTQQTQEEITRAYADFASACPDFRDLVPA